MTADDLLATTRPATESAVTVTPPTHRRHRHQYVPRWVEDPFDTGREIVDGHFCVICRQPQDAQRSRKGKNNRSRGLSIQRDVLRRMGLRHIPGSQLLDGDNDAFTAEVKSGARFSEADWHELSKQRAVSGTRMPLLVKVETPGPGRKARGTVTVDLDDWVAHYGPVA